MSGNKDDEDDGYSYALDGNVDIFDSLFDSNDGKDAAERKDLGGDSDEDDYSFSFDIHKKPGGKKNTKKKAKKEEDRKHQVLSASSSSSSPSYSVKSTHQNLKRKKSLDVEGDGQRTKRRRTSKNAVIIDDDTDDDIFSDDYKSPSSKKGKGRNNKKSGKKMTSGDVIEIDSSSDSEISDYEIEDEDNRRTNHFSKHDAYSCDTEDDEENERDNEEVGNNEATTFRTMSKTLKDIEYTHKKQF